jgi:uncharacterized protein YndB with AHSA1/START domain
MRYSLIAMLLVAAPAAAEVKSSSGTGFESANTVTVKAAAAKVYDAIFLPGRWWNPVHSYSGTAANLSLERKVGGCFCEKLPKGGRTAHLTVIQIVPDETLALSGALGPLVDEGVAGTLFFRLKPAEDGATRVTLSYVVGGYFHGDPGKWAKPVDGVLNDQLGRLARYVETGSPEAPKSP